MECLNDGAGAKADQDETGENAKIEALLSRISRLAGDGFVPVYHSIRASYASLITLANDMETMRQLTLLKDDAKDIFHARKYIANATVPADKFANLAADQETLLTELTPSSLTRAKGRGWNAIGQDAASFKARYSQVYGEHHQRFHDLLPEFQSILATAKKRSAALGSLNTITELGVWDGTNLEALLAALPEGPNPCQTRKIERDLIDHPVHECLVDLGQSVPVDALARLSPSIWRGEARPKGSAGCLWRRS